MNETNQQWTEPVKGSGASPTEGRQLQGRPAEGRSVPAPVSEPVPTAASASAPTPGVPEESPSLASLVSRTPSVPSASAAASARPQRPEPAPRFEFLMKPDAPVPGASEASSSLASRTSSFAPAPESAPSPVQRTLGTGRFATDLSALGSGSFATETTADDDSFASSASGASAKPARQSAKSSRKPIEEIAALGGSDDGFLFDDPLVRSPRTSTIVLNLVFAALFLAGFAGVYWLGVRTVDGQRYDDLVWMSLQEAGAPSVLDSSSNPLSFAYSPLVIGAAAVFAVAALVIAAVRRRWWLIGQLVVFVGLCVGGAEGLKKFLPREQLDLSLNNPANTLPSGHTALAAAAMMALLLALPRVTRWVGALLGAALSAGVGVAVIVGQWHRPSDVVAAYLLVGGIAFLTLAFTRGSGMDRVGTRKSSVPLQIVAPVMVTGGVMGQLYAAYLMWQLQPGLELKAGWAVGAAQVSAVVMVVAIASLTFGLVAAMRQISACPLSKAGRVGEPPAPPKGASRANAIEI